MIQYLGFNFEQLGGWEWAVVGIIGETGVAMSGYLLKWGLGTLKFIVLFSVFLYMFKFYVRKQWKQSKNKWVVACIGSLKFILSDMDMPQDVSHLLTLGHYVLIYTDTFSAKVF